MFIRQSVAVVLAVVSALVLGAVPTSASTNIDRGAGSITPMGTCNVQIGVTTRNNNWINGYGSLSDCSFGAGTATLTIQRSRWFGWEAVASAIVTGPGYDQYVSYNCTGTGVHDFRTLITNDQTGAWKLSNTLTGVSC